MGWPSATQPWLALALASIACGPGAPVTALAPKPTASAAPPATPPPRWTSTGPVSLAGPELDGGRLLLVGSRPAFVGPASAAPGAFASDRGGAPLLSLGSVVDRDGARVAVAHDGRTIVRLSSSLERRTLATLGEPIESLGSLAGDVLVWTRGAGAPVRVALAGAPGEASPGPLEALALPGAPPLLDLELVTPSTGVALFALAGLALTRDGGKSFTPVSPPVSDHVVTGLEVRARGLVAESFGTLEAPIELSTGTLGPFAERPPLGPDPMVTFVSTTHADPLALACERGLPAGDGLAIVASAGVVALVDLATGRVTRAAALRKDPDRQPCSLAPFAEGAVVVACAGRRDDDDDAFGAHVLDVRTLRERSRVDGLTTPTALRAGPSGAALALAPQGDWRQRLVLAGGKAHVVALDDASAAGALRTGEAVSIELAPEGATTRVRARRHGATGATVLAERTLAEPSVTLASPPSEGDDGVVRFALRTKRGLELGRLTEAGLELVAHDGLAEAQVFGARALAMTRETEGGATVVWLEEGRAPRPLGEGRAGEGLWLSAVGARVGDRLLVGTPREPAPFGARATTPPRPTPKPAALAPVTCDDAPSALQGATPSGATRARSSHPGTAAWAATGPKGLELVWLDLRRDERARRASGGLSLASAEPLDAVVEGESLVVLERSAGGARLVRARAGRALETLAVDPPPSRGELALGERGAVAWADERTLSLWPTSGAARALHPMQTLGRLGLAGLDDQGALLVEPQPERGFALRLRFSTSRAGATPLPLDGWSSNESLAERAALPTCPAKRSAARVSLELGQAPVHLGSRVTTGRVVRDVELDGGQRACLRATWLELTERPLGWDALVLEPAAGARDLGLSGRGKLVAWGAAGRVVSKSIPCAARSAPR